MLQAHPHRATEVQATPHTAAFPVLRWALTESAMTNHGANVSRNERLDRDLFASPRVGRAVWVKMRALRTWVSGPPSHERHADILWKADQRASLERSSSELEDALSIRGLTGLVEELMGKDPLEKQILLQRLIHKIKPGDERRQPLIEFTRATALLEKSTLDFLDNSADAFSRFDHIVADGARLLRSVVHELGETVQHGEIKATTLARVILSKLHETHFDDALHLLNQGVRADLRSSSPSALSPQLLTAMSQKSTFSAVRMGMRVSSDLSRQLINIGVNGHFSSNDLARVLLIGAESGSSELHYLLSRYLGPEVTESVCKHRGALEKFKQAFVALPIALWPLAHVHRRDRLLLHVDRLLVELPTNEC